MLSDALLIFIVLAPGLVALTGLVHKFIGDKIVMYTTTGVVLTAGALSLLQLFSTLYHLCGGFGFISSAGFPSSTINLAQHCKRFSYSIIEII